jgi:conjugal transfer pilin signal peptidase TrbI
VSELDTQTVKQNLNPVYMTDFFKKKSVKGITVALLLVAISAGVSALVAQQFQRRTVVFNMKGTIDLFMQQSAKKQLDENSARAMTARFDKALKESLTAWQQQHDDLILVPPAVVMPVLDITPEIQTDISRRMQELP